MQSWLVIVNLKEFEKKQNKENNRNVDTLPTKIKATSCKTIIYMLPAIMIIFGISTRLVQFDCVFLF